MSDFELKPHATISKPDAPVMVCILDGWGENKIQDEYNAICAANTPVMDSLKATSPDLWRTVQVRRRYSVLAPLEASKRMDRMGNIQ